LNKHFLIAHCSHFKGNINTKKLTGDNDEYNDGGDTHEGWKGDWEGQITEQELGRSRRHGNNYLDGEAS
jgi:hypothetical protein